jgi:hypothetical protein
MLPLIGRAMTTTRNPTRGIHTKPPKLVKWDESTTDEMGVGFIAVTKKGQDLTRAGEKDDLLEIFGKQMEEYRQRREKEKAEQGGRKEPEKRPLTVGK